MRALPASYVRSFARPLAAHAYIDGPCRRIAGRHAAFRALSADLPAAEGHTCRIEPAGAAEATPRAEAGVTA